MLAQYLGAFIGAALMWLCYFESIRAMETGKDGVLKYQAKSAGIFVTFPAQNITVVPAFCDQVFQLTQILTKKLKSPLKKY